MMYISNINLVIRNSKVNQKLLLKKNSKKTYLD